MPAEDPNNPYAPPVSADAAIPEARPLSIGGGHYRMSTSKLALMSLLTLGLYDVAFFWRHWRAIRNAGEDVWVVPRTLFSVVYCFALTRRIERGLRAAGLGASFGLRYAALFYLSFTLADNLAGTSDSFSPQQLFLISAFRAIATIYPLVSIQTAANRLLDARRDTTRTNDGIHVGTILMGLVGILLWSFSLSEAFARGSAFGEPNLDP